MREHLFNRVSCIIMALAVAFVTLLVAMPSVFGLKSSGVNLEYETKLFKSGEVLSIDIRMPDADWEGMLNNALSKEYVACDIAINGAVFTNVAIRPKGNSSLSSTANSENKRVSLKVEFDHYVKGQNCYGLDKLALNNGFSDNSYMKEYVSYAMFSYMDVPTPLSAFANITVNGEPWGLYLAVECLEESFALRNYGTSYGELYKPETSGMGGGGQRVVVRMDAEQTGFNAQQPATDMQADASSVPPANAAQPSSGFNAPAADGSAASRQNNAFMGGGASGTGTDLVYNGDDTSVYSGIFDNAVFSKTSKKDYKRVITALEHLSEGDDLETYIDVDEVLRYFAVNTAVVNLDHYTSNMKHNYYLYEEDGQLSMLPWDYNMAFGGFGGGGRMQNNTQQPNEAQPTGGAQRDGIAQPIDGANAVDRGMGNMGGMGSNSASSTVHFPIDTPISGTTLEERPILGKLLEVPKYAELYHAYLQEIVTGFFDSGLFEQLIDQTDALIAGYVQADPTSFTTFTAYKTALETLKPLGLARAASIQGQLDGSIPSTTEGQTANPDALFSTDAIDMGALGSMGGGAFRLTRTEDQLQQNDANSDAALEGANPPPFGQQGANGEWGQVPPNRGERARPDGQGGMPGVMQMRGDPTAQQAPTADTSDWILAGVCFALLVLGIFVVQKVRRRKYLH